MRTFILIFFLLPASLWRPASSVEKIYAGASLSAQSPYLTQRLQQQLKENPSAYVPVLIVLNGQVDVHAMHERFLREHYPVQKRIAELLPALQEKAAQTQGALLEFLRKDTRVQSGSLRSFWIVNMLSARVKPSLLDELLLREEIAYIDWDAPLQQVESTCVEDASLAPSEPDGIEPGLAAIKAPALWAKGYTGYGRVAFVMDTGVDPNQPATSYKYRGLYLPDSQTWYSQNGAQTPYDCDGHGTHVSGTVLGLDRLNDDTIGVAFNAQWIGGAVLCGLGTSDNISGFQWSLNPDGDVNTTDDIPDAINNSWYDPTVNDDCDNVYVPVLEAMEAAGIAVIFSAGNEGPDAQTITPPHNINISLVNSFTVGALNGNVSSLPIAGFSSRGPSVCGGDSSLLIKPEVSAPGVQVRSCVPGGYAYYNGTSMASPHVTGSILLLKEAFPYLTGEELKYALYYSCTDLGDPGEDNTYGMGIINVEAAYDSLVAWGNTPVPPAARERELILLDFSVQDVYCAGDFFGSVQVENGGTDTIYTFALHLFAADGTADAEVSWSGTLLPGERLSWDFPALNLPQGNYELWAELTQPNGEEDQRPLNNRLRKQVHITNRPYVEAGPASEVLLCEGSQVALQAQSFGAGEPVYQWYFQDAEEPFAEGASALSPPLSQDTVLRLETSYTARVGMEDRDLGDGMTDTEVQNEGLVFDAFYPFVLKSVKVYVEQPGIRILYLRNSDGDLISQKIVSLSDTGEQRIELNISVPAGNDLRLLLGEGVPLYFSTSGMDFPYEVEDVLRIKYSRTFFGNSPAWYMYFYDWEISYEELCGPVEIPLTLSAGQNAPTSGFYPGDTLLTLYQGSAELAFTDTSQNAVSYLWDFGDGQTSGESNPVHIYTDAGSYAVTQWVFGAAGCSSAALGRVEAQWPVAVAEAGEEALEVRVFPNPTRGEAVWSFSGPLSTEVIWRLYDLTGRLRAERAIPAGQQTWAYSLQHLPKGMYYWVCLSPSGKYRSGSVLKY